MSGSEPRGSGARRASSAGLLLWRELPHERRLAAIAAFGLFLTLFLPWYQGEVITGGVSGLRGLSYSLTGWQSFTWVEAAVLLVAVGVLLLLFMRGRGDAFHVPGGDGGVITAAGLWTCVLVLWRMFDKQGVASHGQYDTATGIEWGIFVALAVGAFLAYSGSRISAAHEPEPPLPGEPGPRSGAARRPWRRRGSGAARPPVSSEARTVVRSSAPPTPPEPITSPPPQRPTPPASERPTVADRRPPSDPVPDRHDARTEWVPDRHDARTERVPDRDDARTEAFPVKSGPAEHRPRSLGEPTPRDAAGRGDTPAARGLDRREIQDLDIAEPPTARLGRTPAPPSPHDDDQLTIPLDRPTP